MGWLVLFLCIFIPSWLALLAVVGYSEYELRKERKVYGNDYH